MANLDIKIKRFSEESGVYMLLPQYQTEGAAGMDLRANISEPVVISAHSVKAIKTGVGISLPIGIEAQIRGRSGLAAKHGIGVCQGTIDFDYRGEIHVLMVNYTDDDFIVNIGDRIAQMVFNKVEIVNLVETDELDETKRGEGRFGHTGIN